MIQGERGMALVLVLVFTAALMILGSALISFAVNEQLITTYNQRNISLYYLAEAGIEAAIVVLREDFNYDRELHGTLGKGRFTVTIINIDHATSLITSEALLDGFHKYLTVQVKLDDDQVLQVERWHRPTAVKPLTN